MQIPWKTYKIKYQKARFQKFSKTNRISKQKVPKKFSFTLRVWKKELPRKFKNSKTVSKKRFQEKAKECEKVEKILQQIKQLPFSICTICHQNLYQRSVKLFKHKKISHSHCRILHSCEIIWWKILYMRNIS